MKLGAFVYLYTHNNYDATFVVLQYIRNPKDTVYL